MQELSDDPSSNTSEDAPWRRHLECLLAMDRHGSNAISEAQNCVLRAHEAAPTEALERSIMGLFQAAKFGAWGDLFHGVQSVLQCKLATSSADVVVSASGDSAGSQTPRQKKARFCADKKDTPERKDNFEQSVRFRQELEAERLRTHEAHAARDREAAARCAAEAARDRETAARCTAEASLAREVEARHIAEAARDAEASARQRAETEVRLLRSVALAAARSRAAQAEAEIKELRDALGTSPCPGGVSDPGSASGV